MARKATKRKTVASPKCKIDHKKKGALPEFLCRCCHPELKAEIQIIEDQTDFAKQDQLINPPTAEKIKEEKVKPSKKKAKVKVKRISVRDRMIEKSHIIIGQIEEMVDRDERESVYDWMQKNNIGGKYGQLIIDKYQPQLDELYAVYTLRQMPNSKHPRVCTDDEIQLLEGYIHLNDEALQDKIVTLELIIRDAARFGTNAKKMRKPRKKRLMSVEKKLKFLKFQKDDKDLKIASIDPAKIIGAQQLWTFHTRTKVVTVFNARNRDGLEIKRSKIIDFDVDTSKSYKTGRSTQETVESILNGGKVVLRNLTEDLKPAKMQNRITKQTILLRVL